MEAYEQLERSWAEFNGLDPEGMVACSSGTAALHLALESLQLPSASQVIMSDFNMVACPIAVALAWLEPVFVDCDERLLIDLPELGTRSRGRNWSAPQAYILSHIYGRHIEMDVVSSLAASDGCIVIEDLAEAHGIRPHKQTDAACWSFYKNKIVAGEEGGAVWFKKVEHANLARQLRSLGFTAAHDFTHIPFGHNYRMSNAHARLILDSLENYEFNRYRRRQAERAYDHACPDEWRMPHRDAVWVYDFRIPGMTSVQQDRVVAALRAGGVAARHAFKPMRLQKQFKFDPVSSVETRADMAAREVIYVPVDPSGTLFADHDRATAIFDTVRQALNA